MKKQTDIFELANQVTTDEEGFLAAATEADCEEIIYTAPREVENHGSAK